ncbi:MAG: hypothetical protein K5776_00350 [Lachnospiraceae bacterium]|nr:hypothetical protein [Lachnospiraceae bacterium]
MTVRDLANIEEFKQVSDMTDTEITKVFCCDLLSIAMGKAPAGSAWVTVMANVNTLAVATLTDVACIILAEGVSLENDLIEKAKEEGIAVLKTDLSIFDSALLINKSL